MEQGTRLLDVVVALPAPIYTRSGEECVYEWAFLHTLIGKAMKNNPRIRFAADTNLNVYLIDSNLKNGEPVVLSQSSF